MCGIAGIVGPLPREEREARVRAMVATMRDRGPDGDGVTSDGPCTLGHARLAVVDLTSGAQPMRDERGALITFNGEIYGYRALRARLGGDARFRTTSDTEVILALHAIHGADVARALPGMFAFAIWDPASSTLTLARDRFGEKPLFFATTSDDSLVFASTTRAVLASGLVDDGLDARQLSHLLAFHHVEPTRSIYSAIIPLPPAHVAVGAPGAPLRTRRYFSLPPPETSLGLDEAATTLAQHLERAVADTLVADVDVAVLLSSGLDSSVVFAHAARAHPGVRAFTYAFAGEGDESAAAGRLAARFGAPHTVLRDDDGALPAALDGALAALDEPLLDSSIVPTWQIARAVRRTHTVALSGDGGDEIFGGYPFWYRGWAALDEAGELRAARLLLARAARRLAFPRGPLDEQLLARFDADPTRAPAVAGHRAELRLFDDDTLARLALPRVPVAPPVDVDHGAFIAANHHDLAAWLPGDVLVKIDRAAMAHGLEVRAPLLDAELATFVLGLPAALRVTSATDRVLLRHVARTWLPDETLAAPKRGFGAPLARWLARPDVARVVDERLRDGRAALARVLDVSSLPELSKQSPARRWGLFALVTWLDAHPTARPSPRPPEISVLMPVQDCARTVDQALESVLDQTADALEVIVLDDGSIDDTPARVRAHARRDARVRFLPSTSRAGVAARLNESLAAARAPLCARMDGDDVAVPTRFAKQRAFLDDHPDVIALGTEITIVDEDGAPLGPLGVPSDHRRIDDGHLAGRAGQIAHPTLMVRTDVLRAVGGYRDFARAQDYDLFLRLAERGRLANLDEPLLAFRLHPGQSSHRGRAERSRIARQILGEAWARRGLGAPPDGVLVEDHDPSAAELALDLAQRAAHAGHVHSALTHAVRAIGHEPTSPVVWRRAARALRAAWRAAR